MLDSALQYAELGYPVFPCAPGAKRPLTARGLLDATTDIERIEQWWGEFPEANIAIATAGLLVIDLDPLDGKDNPWLQDDPEKLIDLAAGALSRTPRGGRHYIFKQPFGKTFRNTASKLAPKVDTRADGGYILVAPSIVEGKLYSWPGEMRLDVAAARLSEPPQWLIELLEGSCSGATGPSIRAAQTSSSNVIGDGQRNSTLTSLAGTMRRVGMSQTEILAALQRVNSERCKPPLPDKEVETIAWSNARYEPDRLAVSIAEGHADTFTAPRASIENPGKFPEPLLVVPGFISDVIAYNLAGALKPQPVLAMAGALSLLAVLTGRKIADTYGTRTNLYCLGVCASGGGKERARKVNQEILYQSGFRDLLANDDIASHVGLINRMVAHPASLFQLDEIGRMLKTLSTANPSQQNHLYQIPSILMKLFGNSDSHYTTPAKSDTEQSKTIHQPHACLYGTTVPKSLFEGLTAENVSDGFLSRMLVFESDEPDPDPQFVKPAALPIGVIEIARFWGELKTGGNLTAEFPIPKVIDYADEADAILIELESMARKERRKNYEMGEIATLWTRTTEKARKLALLWACSINHRDPYIDRAAARWGADLSEFLTRKILAIANEHIAENQHESRFKRVLRLIISSPEGLSQAQLCRKTRWLSIRERDEVLNSLLLSGEIKEETIATPGRYRTVYKAT